MAKKEFYTPNGILAKNETLQFTGDVTSPVINLTEDTSVALTIANSGVTATSYTIASFTVNAKGLITTASSATTTGSGSVVLATSPSISNLTTTGTLTAGAVGGQATFASWFTGNTAFWINMPTTGPSGIGSGGAGTSPWVAYAAASGQWFSDASAGDNCYRNTAGKLLFGTSTGAYNLAILSNGNVNIKDNLGIGTASPGTKLEVFGSITARPASTQDAVILAGRAGGTTSLSVTLTPTTLTASRTLTLPDTTGTIVTTGDSGTVTSTMIADGTIVNGDINASAAIAVSKLAASTISGITLGNNLNTLTLNVSGTGLSGSTTYNGSAAATFTVTSNATSANTASTIVARDASGNFTAGTITATTLAGTLSTAAQTNITSVGTLTSLTISGNLTVDTNTLFVDATNNRVGIGTTSPAIALDLGGGTNYINGTTTYTNILTSAKIIQIYDSSQSVLNIVSGANTDGGVLGGIFFSRSLGQNDAHYNVAGITAVQKSTGTLSGGELLFYTKANSSPFERMRIDKDGNVGIGIAAPSYTLDIKSSGNVALRVTNAASTDNVQIRFRGAATNAEQWAIGNEIATNGTGRNFDIYDLVSAANRFRISSTGEVMIAGTTDQGAFNLQCNGTGVWGAGAYTNGSDLRLKENVKSLDFGLDVIDSIRPVTFQYKPDYNKDQSIQTGFIAQELLEALKDKEYVNGIVQKGNEYLSVAYQNFIPILVKAIQELNLRINQLENK